MPQEARHTRQVEEERPEGADLWLLIEGLTEEVKSGQADIAALVSRADASDARADESEARADKAEVRADEADARADQADIRADIGDVRVDTIAAAEIVDREMIAELQADGELSRQHAEEMQQALLSSRVIGAAIGMLMASRSLNEAEAFAVLRRVSQNSNRKLRDIAQTIVRDFPGDEHAGSRSSA